MIQTKHILTTNQEPDRLYIPPTIEVVEVEEECVLAGSPITTGGDGTGEKGGDSDIPQPPGAKSNNIFFFDNFSEDTNDDNLDY